MAQNPFASDWLRGGAAEAQRPHGGLSYVSGTTDDPLQFITLARLLDDAVRDHGAAEAAIFCETGERLSWHDLRNRADDVAAGLLALGVQRGDRVGIWAPNCAEWLAVQFGTARIGAILVNINPAYRSHELEYALNKVQCRVLVMARSLKSSDYVQTMRQLAPELIYAAAGDRLKLARFPRLRHVVLIGDGPAHSGMWQYKDFIRSAGPAHRARIPALAADLDPDDAINIQFTSGTTGSPKGATLSHFNIVNNARYCARAMKLTHRDRLCIPVPLYHCFGMVLGVLCCAAAGSTMVFPAATFDAESTLRALQAERCTAMHGVPTMFMAVLDHPRFGEFELGALRTGIMAGAPCPIETMRRVVSAMHMNEVTIGYGMTETSPISMQSAVDDPLDKRVTTVGRIQPHCEVKIVDAQGRIVPVGVKGELCTRGYLVMRGYWEDPERTAESIDASGWMHSGDLATIDADGWCNIVGRAKDMLIRGGENVFPREVEEYLQTHPKVQSVQVFGVPDARLGEEVCAWIVLKPGQSATADEIRTFCRDRIAHYKVPRHVKFVPDFPLTATGKAQKFVMREQMKRELGVSEVASA